MRGDGEKLVAGPHRLAGLPVEGGVVQGHRCAPHQLLGEAEIAGGEGALRQRTDQGHGPDGPPPRHQGEADAGVVAEAAHQGGRLRAGRADQDRLRGGPLELPAADHLHRPACRRRVDGAAGQLLGGGRLLPLIQVGEQGAVGTRLVHGGEQAPVRRLGQGDAGGPGQRLGVVQRGGQLAAGLGQERRAAGQVADGLDGLAALLPDLGLAQLAGDRRRQAGETVLEDVVVGPGPHRLDRRLLADGPRDDDEGEIHSPLLHDLQGRQAAEAGHPVVGDDGVPAAPGQGLAHPLGGVDPLVLQGQARGAQLLGDQLGVVGGIVDDEEADGTGTRHDRPRRPSRRAAGGAGRCRTRTRRSPAPPG